VDFEIARHVCDPKSAVAVAGAFTPRRVPVVRYARRKGHLVS
jgi:hypothetical protein